jgi:pSer/pThr/pTyr-binding forkhead associated (FHA) protein
MAHASFKLNEKQFAAFDLNKPLLIGRSSDCDLSVRDTRLSRRHICLEPDRDGWLAVDLNSSNGTYVEGERIARRQLEDGDLIEAGPISIIFHEFRPPTIPPIAFTQQVVIDAVEF